MHCCEAFRWVTWFWSRLLRANLFLLPSCNRVHPSGSIADARIVRSGTEDNVREWIQESSLSPAEKASQGSHLVTNEISWITNNTSSPPLETIADYRHDLPSEYLRVFMIRGHNIVAKQISETTMKLRCRHLSKLNHVICHRLGVRLLSRSGVWGLRAGRPGPRTVTCNHT